MRAFASGQSMRPNRKRGIPNTEGCVSSIADEMKSPPRHLCRISLLLHAGCHCARGRATCRPCKDDEQSGASSAKGAEGTPTRTALTARRATFTRPLRARPRSSAKLAVLRQAWSVSLFKVSRQVGKCAMRRQCLRLVCTASRRHRVHNDNFGPKHDGTACRAFQDVRTTSSPVACPPSRCDPDQKDA